MTLPSTNFDPGFRITRTSHVVLTIRDLAASRQFYEKVIGLILTAEEDDTLYFRGVEEACLLHAPRLARVLRARSR